jgi:hypothetical protein
LFSEAAAARPVLVLRNLAPDDQRHVELHGRAYGDGEDAHVLGPGDVADLGQTDPVELGPDARIRRHLDIIDAQPLQVLDVLAAERREIAGGRGHA